MTIHSDIMRLFKTFTAKSMTSALAASVLLASCVEDFQPNLPESATHYLVVQGDIVGQSVCTFYFDYTRSLQGGNDDNPRLADVRVVGDDGSDFPCHKADDNPNAYRVTLPELKSDVRYALRFRDAEGNQFETVAELPVESPSIDGLHYYVNNQFSVIVTVDAGQSSYGKNAFLRWECDECWEIRTPYSPDYEYNPEKNQIVPIKVPKHRGWAFNTFSMPEVLRSDSYANCVVKRFPIHSVACTSDRLQTCYRAIVKQYGISKKEHDFIVLRQRMAESMGGLFTPLPSELPSNVRCMNADQRVLGYVGVTTAPAVDTLYVFNKDVIYKSSHNPRILTPDEIAKIGSYGDLYARGYRVAVCEPRSGLVQWAPQWCVDSSHQFWGCTVFEAPEGWPKW